MKVTTSKLAEAVVMIALLVLLAVPAQAEKPRFDDTFTLSLGAMRNGGDGAIAATSPDLPLDRLTFADLNLDNDKNIFWADIGWRFAERWELGFSYSSFDTDGLNVASTGGNFEGIEWEIGAFLASSFDIEIFILDLTWDFLSTEKGRLGVGAGLHAADLEFDFAVGVFASVGGGDVEYTLIGVEENSVLAPLPNLAVTGSYKVADKVYLEGDAGWLSLSYGEYDGDLYSLRGVIEWRPWQHVGLGLGYQYVDIDVVIDRSDYNEIYDLTLHGPILFLSIGF